MRAKEITLADFEVMKLQYQQDKDLCDQLQGEYLEKENLLKLWFKDWLLITNEQFYHWLWSPEERALPIDTPLVDIQTLRDEVIQLQQRVNALEQKKDKDYDQMSEWFEQWVAQICHQLNGGETEFMKLVNDFEDELVWTTWTNRKYKRANPPINILNYWGVLEPKITIRTFKKKGDTTVSYTLTELFEYIKPYTKGGNREANFNMVLEE